MLLPASMTTAIPAAPSEADYSCIAQHEHGGVRRSKLTLHDDLTFTWQTVGTGTYSITEGFRSYELRTRYGRRFRFDLYRGTNGQNTYRSFGLSNAISCHPIIRPLPQHFYF